MAQKLFYTQETPTQQQIDDYLSNIGLNPEERYYYGNDYVSVTDVNANSDNVLLNHDGKLLFIDPIIKMKKSLDQIISAYPFIEQNPSQKKSLLARLRDILNKTPQSK